jgi:predicted SprT family Zn-dependent metalloprotease
MTTSIARESHAVRVAQAYLGALAKAWKQPWLRSLTVIVNPRLSTAAGRCITASGVIELSRKTTRRVRRVQREVVCHEAAHAVVWRRLGRSVRPHGPEWRALVRAAGFEPRPTLTRCGARHDHLSRTLFMHVCDVCHFAKRARRRMTLWRCPECRAIGLEGLLRIDRVSGGR